MPPHEGHGHLTPLTRTTRERSVPQSGHLGRSTSTVFFIGTTGRKLQNHARVASPPMQVLRDLATCPRLPGGTVVTIGAYDGVHLGHRRLIGKVRQLAAERGCASAVVTFDRHPALIVRPESAPKLLTDLETRLQLLAETGVDYTLVMHFDEARSKEPADDFVRTVLVDCLAARLIVVGHDFHFGHNREGNVAFLERLGPELGFEVLGIDLFAAGEEAISSTRVRALLTAGDVAAAARLLGRPHLVRGTVARGDARGRELGFPTANVEIDGELCLPADGIYAGWYQRPDGARHPAAISLGRRPTFYEDAPTSLLEAYLLDFEGDLYGEPAAVEFVARLRGEERFDGVDALVAQMGRDVLAARTALGV
jgi:riboflavin kinase / FMN adenylyltransferase